MLLVVYRSLGLYLESNLVLVDLSNIIDEVLVTYLRVNSNIITEEIARTISRLLNNIVLGLDRILNKALKTYRLLIAP